MTDGSVPRARQAIDVWSVGCILAEMLSGKPLFPGRDYHHQLTLILDVLGTPTLDEFYAINSRRSRDYIRALPFRKKKPFAQLFPNASPQACDFLQRTLTCTSPDDLAGFASRESAHADIDFCRPQSTQRRA